MLNCRATLRIVDRFGAHHLSSPVFASVRHAPRQRPRLSSVIPSTSPPSQSNTSPTISEEARSLEQTIANNWKRKRILYDDVKSRRLQNPTLAQKLLDESYVGDSLSSPAQHEFPSDVDDYYKAKYRNYNDWARDQAKHAYRPKVEPRETSLLLFPGEGSQFVGMGRKLLEYPNVVDMYEVASEILGYDLLEVCLNGPKDKLDKTVHCQPAVVVTSLAAVEKLKQDNAWAIENCVSVAGYSVGEFSALAFSGAITFEDAVRLVKIRAEAMQKASEMVSGRMMTVHLTPAAKVNFACHAAKLYCTRELGMENVVCAVSNFLFPGCKTLAGNTEALRFIELNARDFGISRVQYVPASGAFHSPLMLPARRSLSDALSSTPIAAPIVPVHANVTGCKYGATGAAATRARLLADQMCKPVRWEQTMHVLYSRPQGDAFPRTFEVGPGRMLGAMLKRVNEKAHDEYTAVDV